MQFRPSLLLVATALLGAALPGCLAPSEPNETSAQPTATTSGRGQTGGLPFRGTVEPFVVVATLDTGVNPLHPTWRRDQPYHPSAFIPGFPTDAESINLVWKDTFRDSINASRPGLERFLEKKFPYWIPGTNIIGTWAHPTDGIPIFDIEAALRGQGGGHYHGQPAASQIAGEGYSLAPDAYIVIMDRTNQGGGGVSVYQSNADGLRWAGDQSWIDIIHTNIQDPVPLNREQASNYPDAVAYAVNKGKLVVSAGGNFYALATETSPHAGPRGVLAAGANDNCGYADFSNPNPHVVMDGYNTVAAQASGWGNQSFGGTSSASPRTTGYAAQVLLEVRKALNYTAGFRDGHLIALDPDAPRPAAGPLADGKLHASELHELIRKTANPNPHASRFDGGQAAGCIPQPANLPVAFYPKMGYGEISEHTITNAINVALGKAAMPARPVEDAFFAASQIVRQTAWETAP